MPNQIQKSSTARIVSIIVLFGIIPAWFFYIGIQYDKTMQVLQENNDMLTIQLSR